MTELKGLQTRRKKDRIGHWNVKALREPWREAGIPDSDCDICVCGHARYMHYSDNAFSRGHTFCKVYGCRPGHAMGKPCTQFKKDMGAKKMTNIPTPFEIPTCRKHKTQSCMSQYYVGDGVNHPIDLIWLCKRTMNSKGFKLMKKKHGTREVNPYDVAVMRLIEKDLLVLERKRIMSVLRKCALIDRFDFAVEGWKVFLEELEKIITPKKKVKK